MKILKSISIFFLLLALTCSVVFLPHFISRQREEDILDETIHRNYYASNRPKLTSEQVARLYFNREIAIEYNAYPINIQNIDSVRQNITELLQMLLQDEETTQGPIKDILTDSNINYSRSSNLVKIENQPTALNFVSYNINKENMFLDILYEEKTKTIINFSCFFEKEFETTKDIDLYVQKILPMIDNYYGKQLYFSQYEYYFTIDFPMITEKEENTLLSTVYINCGLKQLYDKFEYEYKI